MVTAPQKPKNKNETTAVDLTKTYNQIQITSARSAAIKVASNASMGKLHAMVDGDCSGSSPVTGSTCFGAIVEADPAAIDDKPKKKNVQNKKPKTGSSMTYQTTNEESLYDAMTRGSIRGSKEAVDLTPSSLQGEEKSAVDMDSNSFSTISTISKFSKKLKRVFPKGGVIELRLKRSRSSGSGNKNSSTSPNRTKHPSVVDVTESNVDMKTKKATENAWICGLCGSAFSGQRLAEVHEFNCVRETFYKTVEEEEEEEEKEKKEEEARATSSQVLDYFNSAENGYHNLDKAAVSGDKSFNSSLERIRATTIDNGTSKNEAAKVLPQPKNENAPPEKSAQPVGLIPLSNSMRQCILMTDESLLKVTSCADLYIVTTPENDAERELALLSRDRAYYDVLNRNAAERAMTKNNPLPTSGKGVLSEICNKFAEAYDLMKNKDGVLSTDEKKDAGKGENVGKDIIHCDDTLYINVIIMNSVIMVNNEMKRLADQRWGSTVVHDNAVADADKNEKDEKDNEKDKKSSKEDEKYVEKEKVSAFEKFRLKAHRQMVRIASLALRSDFVPRKVAVQLSNDLMWLLGPQLQLRGVSIETQIEYRAGPYFVLGVNVKSINWVHLIKHSHKQIVDRRRAYEEEMESIKMKNKRLTSRMSLRMSAGGRVAEGGGENEGEGDREKEKRKGPREKYKDMIRSIKSTTESDIVATVLSSMYYINWIVVIPICSVFYRFGARRIVDKYILNSVTNDIFRYVEKRGMEMELRIVCSKDQASFTYNALREIRADDRKHKKKQEEIESVEGEETKELLGPLLGPDIKEDAGPAKEPPSFVPPENLEHVGLEMELPVGFRRVRWAFLSSQSEFTSRAVFEAELGYTENVFGEWSAHNEHIGAPTTPDEVNDVDFIGVEKKSSYLMPKSAFVKANTVHETMRIIEYNDFCFSVKKKTLTPEVPYGNTFIAWTQITVTNKGNNTCQMVCSVEAEFPNGPPMVASQIKSKMRAGTAEKFVATGETVIRYADSYP